jgi:hypothetical protein
VSDGLYEVLDVNVALVVSVDGHTLRTDVGGKARGTRYHGEPSKYPDSVLEQDIRGTVDTCIARATRAATTTVGRLYPVAEDKS